MFDLFKSHNEKIHQEINLIFKDLYSTLEPDCKNYIKLINDLEHFCLGGKGIRGGLVSLCVEHFDPQYLSISYKVAAILEIMHASILVHDDIIDSDELRRNKPTLPALFKSYAEISKTLNASLVGNTTALCVADIGFFLAFRALYSVELSVTQFKQVLQTLSHEFILVGIGELGDIEISSKQSVPEINEVITMYRYKTARYTFSLPFQLAAQICDLPKETTSQLIEYGESLGIIYQIKDDELSLFGQQQKFGKKLGNDILENKQTIFKILLYQKMSNKDLIVANKIFGNKSSNLQDIQVIIDLMKKYKIDKEVELLINNYQKQADNIRATINLPKPFLDVLNLFENELLKRTV